MLARFKLLELLDRVHPLHAKIGFLADGGNVFDGGKRSIALFRVGDVAVEQRQIKLDVYGLFKELAREVQAGFRRIDVFVKIEDEVVRNDRVAGGKEGDEPLNDVNLGGGDALPEVDEVGLKVDLFHGPGVLDAVAKHVVENGETHRPQGEAEARVKDA